MRNKRKEEKEKQIQSTRRLLLIGSGQLLLGAVLVGRLYQLQVAQTAQFQKLSDDNQFNARMIEAPRGRIFDYRGRLLAGNADVFEMNVVLELNTVVKMNMVLELYILVKINMMLELNIVVKMNMELEMNIVLEYGA